MLPSSLHLSLPEWLQARLGEMNGHRFPSWEDAMRYAIKLSAENIMYGGGPFGAVVVNAETRELVSAGVNVVVKRNCSLCHAEMMALSLAQNAIGSFTLAKDPAQRYVLVTSAQMCGMCLTNVVWSGVSEVIYGATAADTERLTGFDEGLIPTDWAKQLETRGIAVSGPVLRDEACAVLAAYKRGGGVIYNGGAGDGGNVPASPPAN